MWCKGEFSASLLQTSVSDDPSEIIPICCFAAQNIKYYAENNSAYNFFETDAVSIMILWWIQRSEHFV